MISDRYDKFMFDSLKKLLSDVVGLSSEEIHNLEERCYQYAITTVRPNSEVTYLLLEKCYKLMCYRYQGANYTQIMGDFKYWMMMPI